MVMPAMLARPLFCPTPHKLTTIPIRLNRMGRYRKDNGQRGPYFRLLLSISALITNEVHRGCLGELLVLVDVAPLWLLRNSVVKKGIRATMGFLGRLTAKRAVNSEEPWVLSNYRWRR